MDIKAELQTALESLVTAFKAICEDPAPTYSIDGQSVSWTEYFTMLKTGIKELSEMIAYFDPVIIKSSVL